MVRQQGFLCQSGKLQVTIHSMIGKANLGMLMKIPNVQNNFCLDLPRCLSQDAMQKSMSVEVIGCGCGQARVEGRGDETLHAKGRELM